MTKKLVWLGMIVGSTLGNAVPTFWGGSALSLTGMLFALIGGVVGIWVGVRLGKMGS